VADDQEGMGLVAGGSIGWQLPSFHPRFDAEISTEIAMQRLSVTATRRSQPGTASLSFWSPLPSIQAGLAFALSPNLAVVGGLRFEGIPARDVERDVTYCDVLGCFAPVQEIWRIGGFSYGVNLGLRLLVD
jgi:hypothetical protein